MLQFRVILSISITTLFITKAASQEITMFPSIWGLEYYQDEIKIDKRQIKELMQTHELTKMYWNKSIKHKRIAGVALGAQVLTSVIVLSSTSNSNGTVSNANKNMLGLSLLSGILAIGYSISSASLRKKGIITYNKLRSGERILANLEQTPNGVGIVCHF